MALVPLLVLYVALAAVLAGWFSDRTFLTGTILLSFAAGTIGLTFRFYWDHPFLAGMTFWDKVWFILWNTTALRRTSHRRL